MTRTLPFALALVAFALCGTANAQRYLQEVFSDANITVTSDVIYGVNVDFLTSKLGAANMATIGANMAELQAAIDDGTPIPPGYFDPTDTNVTKVKVTNLRMDIYQPNQGMDAMTDRPVVIYLHTGNALPPGVNGSPCGQRKDSTAVEACKRMARRGYVAVSMSYRLGWNPLGSNIQIRRGTLLNAIYRAIHDVRQCVRTLKADAVGANTYHINPNKVIVIGEGTGGYISLANATLDRSEELYIEKFLVNPAPPVSYVDTTLVGDLDGFGGFFCLYRPNGQTHETQFCVNLGGALADTSWLAPNDPPMVAFHTMFDPFAPFTEGTVIVPTTGEQVVDVQGSNLFMDLVNEYGNNSSFTTLPSSNPYTNRARSLYGSTQTHGSTNVTIHDGEGLFPLARPAWPPPAMEEASPWQWWDPASPAAQYVVVLGPPAITAHIASMASNPDMSGTKGRTYLDTIMGYMNPRIVCALELGPCSLVGIEERTSNDAIAVWPNPATDNFTVTSSAGIVRRYRLFDVNGRQVAMNTTNAQRFTVQRSNLEAGTYLLELETDNTRVVRKLMLD